MLTLKLLMTCLFLASIIHQIPAEIPFQEYFSVFERIINSDILIKYEKYPAFKKLKDNLPDGVSLVSTFYYFYNNYKKTPNEETPNMNQLIKISTELDKITELIENLENRSFGEAARTNALVIMDKFIEKYSELSKAEHQFDNIMKNYGTKETKLLENLEEFLKEQKKAYNEFPLVDYLSLTFIFATPVDELICFGQNQKTRSSVPKTSTTKLVYDFHIILLIKILRSFTIQELAMELKFKLSGTRYDGDVLFLENRKQEVKEKLLKSLKTSMMKLNDGDLKGFVDLNVNSLKIKVNFQFVLQTYFQREEILSLKDTCTKTCSDYTSVTIPTVNHRNGCRGIAYQCTHEETHTLKPNYMLFENPEFERIYEGFNYADNGWKGKGSQSDPETRKMTAYMSGFVICDICKCICDQTDHPKTVRKIFIGKMAAPKGYVVTGVKFGQSVINVIYMSIQVGKLLPMGVVDPATIYWMNLPNRDDVFTINYDNQPSLALTDKIKFDLRNQAVTGLQLVRSGLEISLKLFGRSLNLTTGTLGEKESEAVDNVWRSQLTFGGRPSIKEGETLLKSRTNAWVQFKMSDEDRDAGQSFVPYFESSGLSFDPPAPFSSIGLSHVTNDDAFAGYVRPTIKSLDYAAFTDEF